MRPPLKGEPVGRLTSPKIWMTVELVFCLWLGFALWVFRCFLPRERGSVLLPTFYSGVERGHGSAPRQVFWGSVFLLGPIVW